MQKQQTIAVNGERIRIVARTRSYAGNPVGYAVWVNEKTYFLNCLSFAEAMAKA